MGETGRPSAMKGESSGALPCRLPPALDSMGLIEEAARGRRLFAAFDFDGTLTPIVKDPYEAYLDPAMRSRLEALSRVAAVAVVTGRGLEDIRMRVGLPDLFYSGCHGFEITGPPGSGVAFRTGEEYAHALEEAGERFERILDGFPGAILQRKRFCLTVHYRLVAKEDVGSLISLVEEAAAGVGSLRARPDKKAVEVLPGMEWNKGSAVLWLLDRLGMTPANSFALYVGDDITDEDGFRAVAGRGAGVIVAEAGTDRGTLATYRLGGAAETALFIEGLTRAASPGAP
ncbi:MAG: trehalose-phosphatase [Thermovirgaceae bacterium]|mgnify:CR=1 FL=1|nr:trehalose-phosphatase [Synergistales bacterium]HPC76300.1 trehalose-phosphatase [Synergistales bacterium]HRU91102.1 trehalose-phosphatase [Thermovirgaceae bacterium]